MKYFPAFLDLRRRPCLVVGGGTLASHKARALLRAGARVRVVAPRLDRSLSALQRAGRVTARRRAFRDRDLEGCVLVIAATDDAAVNRAVYRGSRRRRIPCNVVDQPALCSFIFPSVLRRGDLVIAISTGGSGPALSRRLRLELQRTIGAEYATFLRLLHEARRRLRRGLPDLAARKRAVYRLLDSPALSLVRAGRLAQARAVLGKRVAAAIRAGPGRS